MLPHAVAAPKQRRYYGSGAGAGAWQRGGAAVSDLFGTSRFCLLVVLIAAPSFLLGTTVSIYAGVDCSSKQVPLPTTAAGAGDVGRREDRSRIDTEKQKQQETEAIVERKVQALLKEKEEVLLSKHTQLVHKLVEDRLKEACANTTNAVPPNDTAKEKTPTTNKSPAKFSTPMLNPEAVGNFVAGMALTHKANFTRDIDLGVPLDKLKTGSNHVLMMYSSTKAMPTSLQQHGKKQVVTPTIAMTEAIENCEYLNVLLMHHSGSRKQCLALVPNYESYHLQNWMRVPERPNGLHGKLDPKESLKLVSRGLNGAGSEDFPPPKPRTSQKAFDMLRDYFNSLPTVTKELRQVIQDNMKPYNGNTIIVMVCNFGQSELLINFVCDARSKKFDLSSILVFATDKDTEALAKSMGLAAYYDEQNFGKVPLGAAKRYGDRFFEAMMVSKVVCVQVMNYMGYDVLFQDVDILWYQHPLKDYFSKPDHWSQKYDAIFQDDGGHSVRYAPYSANSGFYFVRHNDRSRSFLNTLLTSIDIVMETDSHQQAMIHIINEQVSLYGLRVKVLSRDSDDLPGGYHWNMKSGRYMKAMFKEEVKPIIFHMSWTLNKDNKLKYFQQMGTWWVEDKCVAKKIEEISGASATNLASSCCSAEPLFTCHYRDKPSIHPCKDSPPIDKGKPSFW